jgi:hypothetical protein
MSLRFQLADTDRHRGLTVAAGIGAGASVALMIFGLPPVDLHPPWHYVGIMDPLCGGTRSARLTMLGEFSEAWRYNPLGILAVLAALVVSLRAVLGLVSGRWLNVQVRLSRAAACGLLLVGVGLFVAMAVRQQQLADLLMTTG